MSPKMEEPLKERLDWAVQIAREAGLATLSHFRDSALFIERKTDDSPVTVADREAERVLRKRIAERFPADAVLGEEMGSIAGSSSYQWVLDPIDGTKSFIHGVPLYTTLVAVLRENEPQIGVIHAPACRETVYAAAGDGCWYQCGDSSPQPARVSEVQTLKEGLILTSEVKSFATDRQSDATDVFIQLQKTARLARTWGDGYGYMMVATGRADAMIDPVMSLWDAAPLQTIIEEAGGQFCDWQGRPTVHSGEAIATNGLVTAEVLAIAKGR